MERNHFNVNVVEINSFLFSRAISRIQRNFLIEKQAMISQFSLLSFAAAVSQFHISSLELLR